MFQFMRSGKLFGFVAAFALLAASTDALAQSTVNATIRGKVTDETGGALPGVTVVATSPALIQGQRSSVTDADGNYAVLDLPIGTYRVVFELAGFQRFVREEIQLTAGFSATLNTTMKIGTLEESITVSGASPVVDTTNTAQKVSLSAQALTEMIPAQRNYREMVMTAPSIAPAKADLVGGAQGSPSAAYGASGQVTTMRDGINARQGTNAVGISPDMAAMEEFQVVTVGGGAEQALPGTFVNIILKSGGNQFHGRYEVKGTESNLIGDNMTPDLRAQGLTAEKVKFTLETTADLGGRIVRDRLWFYGAGRRVRNDRTPFGLFSAPGPDGIYNTNDDVPGDQYNEMHNLTGKLTWQAAQKYKVIGLYAGDAYTQSPQSINRTTPFDSTQTHHNDPHEWKIELQGTPSTRVLYNFLVGENSYLATYDNQPGTEGLPASRDNVTLIVSGPSTSILRRPRSQKQAVGSVSFFPLTPVLGRHELKAGFQYSYQYQGTGQLDAPHGNYLLIFDTVNGVPHQAFQMQTFNFPLLPRNYLAEGGAYVQDTWRLGDRLTVNLGLRMDSFRTWVPEQTKAQGQFGNAGTYPKLPTGLWRPLVPRLGFAYDLNGNGRTVIKGSWGRYSHTPGDDFSAEYNQNTQVTTTYRWRDLNNNGDYDPGEVNLNTNGPDFINITGASNNILNLDLKLPSTVQSTVAVEREIAANFGAKLMYVFVKQYDGIETVNVRRPYNAWNVVLPMRDPGPNGTLGNADDGAIVNVYDYDAAYRGSAFVGNMRINRDSNHEPVYQTIEFVVNRRPTGKWGLNGSISATKTHAWSVGAPQSPNDELNNEYEFWDKQAKLTGNYQLPWSVALSGAYYIYSGLNGQRTFLFRGLPSSSTATLRLEPLGSQRGPVRAMLNMRLAKDVPGIGSGRLRVSVDVLNVLNNASPWAISYTSGPTYGQISSIDQPRIVHAGVVYSF
jgi:hypothetical protein